MSAIGLHRVRGLSESVERALESLPWLPDALDPSHRWDYVPRSQTPFEARELLAARGGCVYGARHQYYLSQNGTLRRLPPEGPLYAQPPKGPLGQLDTRTSERPLNPTLEAWV